MFLRNSLLVAALSMAACAGSWQKQTQTGLSVAHDITKAASAIAEPYFHKQCTERARECGGAIPASCQAMRACQEARAKFNKIAIIVQYLIADGMHAVALADKEAAAAKLVKVLALVDQIHMQLRELGVYK